MNHTKTTVHVWGEKRKREMLGITDGRGDVCPLPCTLCSVAICLPVSLSQREMSCVGLEGQEQPERGTGARPEPASLPQLSGCSRHQPVAGFVPLQNGGRHRAKSRQVLHEC